MSKPSAPGSSANVNKISDNKFVNRGQSFQGRDRSRSFSWPRVSCNRNRARSFSLVAEIVPKVVSVFVISESMIVVSVVVTQPQIRAVEIVSSANHARKPAMWLVFVLER